MKENKEETWFEIQEAEILYIISENHKKLNFKNIYISINMINNFRKLTILHIDITANISRDFEAIILNWICFWEL